MSDEDRRSRIDSLRAAERLVSSPRVRTLLIWIATFVLWPLSTAVIGWLGGKLETRIEVNNLAGNVRVLSGEVAVLTSQQRDLVKAIEALTAAPAGPIFALRADMRYAHANAVRATAMALAAERDKRQKISAGETFVRAFDRKVDVDGKGPADAAELVITKIAPPE
jgi:hypothetical protein